MNYIVRTDARGPENWTAAHERVLALPNRSGVRLFEFNRAHGYRHRWLTIDELKEVSQLDDTVFRGNAFTPFTPSTSRSSEMTGQLEMQVTINPLAHRRDELRQ